MQDIAKYLAEDKDLCAYIASCRAAYFAVNDPSSGVWRSFFERRYDAVKQLSGLELQKKYRKQQKAIRKAPTLWCGNDLKERQTLRLITVLIRGKSCFGQNSFLHPDSLIDHSLPGLSDRVLWIPLLPRRKADL